MTFIADLHIHSKYSRATAKNLDLENIYIAAQIKGITVVGTGDFTHPGWFEEIKQKLIPAEEGLFKLKEEIASACDLKVPLSCRQPVRFMLVSEISNIYKKNERTRKNHNLVFMPHLKAAEAFNAKLAQIGNIKSDGRPILGLDARNLLELTLETNDRAHLIPAHIWTPWFSMLGSKSGFDSLEACFDDLAPHVFAAETGLSSDPLMNRRVSTLDRLTLVSNSDAHSPMKLGREANIFNTDLGYDAIFNALITGDKKKFLGTYEFYPEEGKYHLDGHRKCNLRCMPEISRENGGKCPVCGKTLTLGVLYRVQELADRQQVDRTTLKHPFHSLIPLDDILSEVFSVGPQSKKVRRHYHAAIEKLGSEFQILHSLPVDQIDLAGPPFLAEAIKRMRDQRVHISPGYDGEFGKVRLFDEEERKDLMGQKLMFSFPADCGLPKEAPTAKQTIPTRKIKKINPPPKQISDKGNSVSERIASFENAMATLNVEQARAISHGEGPLMIVAGPGTGKTRTLTLRMASLIRERGIPAERMLALTFTNKAAEEMRVRLKAFLPQGAKLPLVATFHALCLHLLTEIEKCPASVLVDEETRLMLIADAADAIDQVQVPRPAEKAPLKSVSDVQRAKAILEQISLAKQMILGPDTDLTIYQKASGAENFAAIYRQYQELLDIQGLLDYDDLIFKIVNYLENDTNLSRQYQKTFTHLFIDEYQDLNQGQYRITRALAPPNAPVCVIGDPNQSIYGFRGSDVLYFQRFIKDYPTAETIALYRNYRSIETILEASHQLISKYNLSPSEVRVTSGIQSAATVSINMQASEKAEAVFVGQTIENLVGGMGFYSIDFNKTEEAQSDIGFSDIAVLYRTRHQSIMVADIFEAAGIPYQIVSKANRFDRKGISELLALFRVYTNTGSITDLVKATAYMPNGIGRKTLTHLKKWCYLNRYDLKQALMNLDRFPIPSISSHQQLKISELKKDIIRYQARIKDKSIAEQLIYLTSKLPKLQAALNKETGLNALYEDLLQMAGATTSTPQQFTATLALQSEADGYDFDIEKVSLMTMHAAKGLEFPVIFIIGCEDGFHPYKRERGQAACWDEERRLLYVAMTRAKKLLYISHVKKRNVHGKVELRQPSPFLTDIEARLLQRNAPSVIKIPLKDAPVQLELF